jgi:hypothetical protein
MQSVLTTSVRRFASTVGQFVLTASLRAQVNPENRAEFKEVSPERYMVFPPLICLLLTWLSERSQIS